MQHTLNGDSSTIIGLIHDLQEPLRSELLLLRPQLRGQQHHNILFLVFADDGVLPEERGRSSRRSWQSIPMIGVRGREDAAAIAEAEADAIAVVVAIVVPVAVAVAVAVAIAVAVAAAVGIAIGGVGVTEMGSSCGT